MKTDGYGDPEYFEMDLADDNVRDAINSLLPPNEDHDQWVGLVSSNLDGGILAYVHPDNAQRIVHAMNREIFVIAWTGGYEPPSYAVKFSLKEASEQAREWAADIKPDSGDTVDVLRIDPETGGIERLLEGELR